MRHELYCGLSPGQIKERIALLPKFPGRTRAREKVVCGERTEQGGRLWLLMPNISYHGSAEPASLILRTFETAQGTKVVWHFHWVWTIWPVSGILCAQVALILGWDVLRGKLDWKVLPVALYVDMLEILCVLWTVFWLFNLLTSKAFHQIRRSEKWLLQWMEEELLADKPFSLDTVMEQEIARLSYYTEKQA